MNAPCSASHARTTSKSPSDRSLRIAASASHAQFETNDSDTVSGTLARVKATGVARIGYREASIPFSFLARSGRPIGYSIDLCNAIVEEIGRALDRDDLKVEFVKVTSDDRLEAIVENRIDLETFWRALGNPVVHDERQEVWVLGAGADERNAALAGEQAPDFSLPDLAGKPHRLSDLRGKKVFLSTWASW